MLDSEPIPLGHRQTIRRYFELIRPQSAETDAVLEQAVTQEAELELVRSDVARAKLPVGEPIGAILRF